MLSNPPLSLYIHMPWCVRKCPYCDFNSHTQPTIIPEQLYIDRLCQQAKQIAASHSRPLNSIFIGGGTPNLISPKGYSVLMDTLTQCFTFTDGIEITMEANPGVIENQDFAAYRQTGINRLSIGAQSFSDEQLKNLGRIHSAKHIQTTYDNARKAGFENINIDIMHGLINQTIAEGLFDLQQAINLQPNHISWYQLTLEPNTVFAKKPPNIATDDDIFAMEKEGFALLQNHQYQHYEVSAFGKPNQHSQHNMNYWQFGDYIGLGAGAHGKITDLQNNLIYRTTHYKRPETYMQSDHIYATQTFIPAEDLAFEFMLNALRLNQPISFDLFEQRTGLPISTLEKHLSSLINKQFITMDRNSFSLTSLGRRYLNDVIAEFL